MPYTTFKNKLIRDFEVRRDMLVVQASNSRLESLFGIKDSNDRLYMRILNAFEMIAVANVEDLIVDLCQVKRINYFRNPDPANLYDLGIEIDGVERHIKFKGQPSSMNSSSMSRMMDKIKEDTAPVMMVFFLKDGVESRAEVSRFNARMRSMGEVDLECLLFEDFLELAFGEDEKNKFREAMVDFKAEMHKAIGYQVTELCSPYNLGKLKDQLKAELINFDYDGIKQARDAEMIDAGLPADDLNHHNFNTIKQTYIEAGRHQLLLGNSDFAESYMTSEWLYKKYFALDELDNTFIVAGFLKSIEQLLWDIVFMVGQGRKIKEVEISEATQNNIDKTLGALQYFLNSWSNDDLFQNSFGDDKHVVMRYLKNQISTWRTQYRNGFFHKHNLNDRGKIEAIREETYFLYLLILGTIKLTPSQILQLS